MITRTDKASAVILVVFSALFAIAATLPAYAQYEFSLSIWLLVVIGISALTFIGLSLTSVALNKLSVLLQNSQTVQKTSSYQRKIFIICFAIIEIAFLFALLSNYPGLCSSDSNAILYQVTGQEYYTDFNRYYGLSNAHPIFYTLLIWAIFQATAFIGSFHASLFIFMFVQISYVAAILAYSLIWLLKTGASKPYIATTLAFIVFSPIISAHVIVLWKDIPFAATLLLLVIYLSNLIKTKKPSRKQIITLGVLLLLISLFRNNGYYIALFVLAYLIIFRSFVRKQAAVVAILLVAVMSFYQGPVFSALSISQAHFAESVGVPLQQLAATIAAEGEMDESTKELLDNILPLNEWEETYNPAMVNPLKFHEQFNDEYLDTHKMEFLAAWARTLPSNLSTYIRAWVFETYGYWQPGYTAPIAKVTTNTDEEYPITAFMEEAHDLIGLSYSPQSIANALRGQFNTMLGMGSLIWILLAFMTFGIIAALRTSKSNKMRTIAGIITPYIPLIGLLITLLISAPIRSEFRYVFGLYLVLPFLPQLYILGCTAAEDSTTTSTKPPRRAKTNFMILIREWLFPIKPEKRS